MSEFTEMIKEAFVGEEPFDARPGRDVLQASIRKLETRMRTVRFMTWFAVAFFSVVWIYCLVWLLRAPDTATTRQLVIYGVLMVWGFSGVGFGKFWFAMMHNDIGLRKEIKRTQLMMLERDHAS